MTPRCALAAVIVALATHAPRLAAQRVTGRVLLPDSVTPAAGVMVVASDAQGPVAVRALTNEHGDFDFRLPHAGRFTIRALRIGFLPTSLPPVDIGPTESRAVRIVARGDRVALATVNVSADRVCQIRKDSGQLVATLWEEASKALAASQLPPSGASLVANWLTYDRATTLTGDTILTERLQPERAPTDRPFVSLAPDSLARTGYVHDSAGRTVYFAPDADALLSPAFAALHCFHVELPGAAHREWVGIAFRPASERRGVSDIEGTLWLDRESAELRMLEYRYTGVRAEFAAAKIGGLVEFLRLPTGTWLVTRWSIRMPRVGRFGDESSGHLRLAIEGLQVAGGEVTSVERDGAPLFTTGITARHDSLTTFVEGGTPGMGCSAAANRGDLAMLYGLLTDGAGRAVVGARITVRWSRELGSAVGSAASPSDELRETTSMGRGWWFLCSVPRERLLWAQAGGAARRTLPLAVRVPADRGAARVDIGLPPR